MSEPLPPSPPPASIKLADPVCGVSIEVPEGWAPGSLKGRALTVSSSADLVTGYGACVLNASPERALRLFLSLLPGRVSVEGARRSPQGVEAEFRSLIPGTHIVIEGVVAAEARERGTLLRYATGSADLPEVSAFTPAPLRRAVLRSPLGEDALSLVIPKDWVVRGSLIADGVAVYEVVTPNATLKYLGESQGLGQLPDPLEFAVDRLGIGGDYMVFPLGLPPVASIAFTKAFGASVVGGSWGYRSYLAGSRGRWVWVYAVYYALPMVPPVWHLGAYVAEGDDALNTLLVSAAHTHWLEKYLVALGKREAEAGRAAMASFRRSMAASRAAMASFRRSLSSGMLSYSSDRSSYSSYDDTGYSGEDWSSGSDSDSEFMGLAEELGKDRDEVGGGDFSNYDMDSGNAEFFIDSEGRIRSYDYGEEVVGMEVDSVGNILDEEGNVIGKVENGYVYDSEGSRVGVLDVDKSDEWQVELYEQNIPGAEWVFGENEFGPEKEEGNDPYHVSRLYRRDEKE